MSPQPLDAGKEVMTDRHLKRSLQLTAKPMVTDHK